MAARHDLQVDELQATGCLDTFTSRLPAQTSRHEVTSCLRDRLGCARAGGWLDQSLHQARVDVAEPRGFLGTSTLHRHGPADRHGWWDLQDAAQVASTDGTTGRRYALHEARHTTAKLLEGEVDAEVIKAIMGHSSIVTSRGYMHVSQFLARKALEDGAAKLGLAPDRIG